MALLASTLINSAKSRTFGSGGLQRDSGAMLLAELAHLDQMAVQLCAQVAPDLLATVTGTATFSDSGNINGYTLEAGIHYRDFVHVDSASDVYKPINIVTRTREFTAYPPSGMLRTGATAGVFYPVDPAGTRFSTVASRSYYDPDAGHTMTYSYVPHPVAPTALSSTLSAPDIASEYILSGLVLAVFLSDQGTPEVRLQMAAQQHADARNNYMWMLYRFAGPRGAKEILHDINRIEDHIT